MSEQHIDSLHHGSDAISGQTARRKFLKQAGGVAVAAPAAILLLSATSKRASAQINPYVTDFGTGP